MASGAATRSFRVFCYGDSLTAGTTFPTPQAFPYAPILQEVLSREPGFQNVAVSHIGLPGWRATEMVSEANGDPHGLGSGIRRLKGQIDLVILMAGTNDLGCEKDPGAIARSIQSLHQIALGEPTVAQTLAIGIPPSGYQSTFPDAAVKARSVNDQLAAYAASDPDRVSFMEFPFEYGKRDARWCPDALHFSPVGYQALAEALAPVVQGLLVR